MASQIPNSNIAKAGEEVKNFSETFSEMASAILGLRPLLDSTKEQFEKCSLIYNRAVKDNNALKIENRQLKSEAAGLLPQNIAPISLRKEISTATNIKFDAEIAEPQHHTTTDLIPQISELNTFYQRLSDDSTTIVEKTAKLLKLTSFVSSASIHLLNLTAEIDEENKNLKDENAKLKRP